MSVEDSFLHMCVTLRFSLLCIQFGMRFRVKSYKNYELLKATDVKGTDSVRECEARTRFSPSLITLMLSSINNVHFVKFTRCSHATGRIR